MKLLCYNCGTLQDSDTIIKGADQNLAKKTSKLLRESPEKYLEKVPGKCKVCANKTLIPEDIVNT